MDAIPDDEKMPDKSFGYGTERVRKAVTLVCGSPHHFRQRDGGRYGRRSAMGCPFVGSPGTGHTQRHREEVYER